MKNSIWDIIFLIGIIFGLLIAFPSYAKNFFGDKFVVLFSLIIIICILFLAWLKFKTKD